jgi:bla regulator protein blaR1
MLAMRRPLLLTLATLAALHAQSFDVASIHPHDPADRSFLVRPPNGGHFTAVGAVPKLLVMLAFDVQDSQIVGGPNWIASEKWDIEAKTEDVHYDSDATRRMLQGLLAERFALKFHRVTEQRPAYVLTVASGGPKLRRAKNAGANIQVSSNSISLQGGEVAQFAGVLATALGRPVIDNTGLTGTYDLYVQWDDAPVREGGVPGTEVSATHGNDRGSIFTAVQEQLGLKLSAQRTSVEVVVIDQIERPSSN